MTCQYKILVFRHDGSCILVMSVRASRKAYFGNVDGGNFKRKQYVIAPCHYCLQQAPSQFCSCQFLIFITVSLTVFCFVFYAILALELVQDINVPPNMADMDVVFRPKSTSTLSIDNDTEHIDKQTFIN